MNAQNWNDILKLLSMMIIGSRDTVREEKMLFRETALSLKAEIYTDLNLSPEMADDWFDLHREDLNRCMSSLYFDKTLSSILGNLKSLPNKKPIIVAMIKMTLTENGERSKNENKVLGGINDAWGNPKPMATAG